ncbi:MAG: class B sortase [Clostridia bacterium]|nr:class B sortase [Clostridia bacterium]
MNRKVIIFFDKCFDRIILLASLLFFLVCFYAMYDAAMVYYNANDRSILKYKPDLTNPEILREISENAIAWITVDDTKIDYPVMQGADNKEYLNKDPFGKYTLSGSIFLDYRCSRDFSDSYSLLYGHHMEYGTMFGALDNFKKREYFDSHRTGQLITVGGKLYKIRFFAATMAQATDQLVFRPEDATPDALIEELSKSAIIYEPPETEGDLKLIALSTCQSADTIDRMVVFGVMQESS